MKAELYIMRCKVDYLEALREKLEKFIHHRGIEVVENSKTIMDVYVYEQKYGNKLVVVVFSGVDEEAKTFTFYL